MWVWMLLLAMADLAAILKSMDDPARKAQAEKQLIALARAGDSEAQWEAARLSRKGMLPSLPEKLSDAWYASSLARRNPKACLAESLSLLDRNQEPESWLRCAAEGRLPEGQYLLGRLILNRIAAEDEPQRFEGLAWIALAAKSGFGPAERRWQLLLVDLPYEDLERVEQTAKKLL